VNWHKKFPLLYSAFSFPALLIVILLALIWLLSLGKGHDPDIWWHLHNAEHLFQTHHFPNQDTYSFTVGGRDWINHEWLAEIPFYLAWQAGGRTGVWLSWVALVEMIFLCLLYLCYLASGNIKASIVAACLPPFHSDRAPSYSATFTWLYCSSFWNGFVRWAADHCGFCRRCFAYG
jgi:hypothetical protein